VEKFNYNPLKLTCAMVAIDWIDLNSDLGEGFGRYHLAEPEQLAPHLTSCNVACGFHGGDPVHIRNTLEIVTDNFSAIGAHPGTPDRMGFGRRYLDMEHEEAKQYTIYQIGALQGIAKAAGADVEWIFPHSRMFTWGNESIENAEAIVEGVNEVSPDISYLATADMEGPMAQVFEDHSYELAGVFHPQLEYTPEGLPVHDRSGGETDLDAIADRMVKFVEEGVAPGVDGESVDVSDRRLVDIHSDSENAPEMAQTVVETVEERGVEVKPAVEEIG
jgi:UPF0271 protein